MVHIIITGATGAVGSEVFRQALLHPSITRLTLLLRRPLPPDLEPSPPSPKLTTIIHSDFLSYPSSLLDQIRGADGVLWCMGVTGAVTRSTPENGYDAVTRDYPIAAAKAFSTLKNKGEGKFVFAYLSAAAANQVEGSYWLHAAKIKGEAEAALAALPASHTTLATYFFRPAPIFPVTPSADAGLATKVRRAIFTTLFPFFTIFDAVLGRAMIESVLEGSTGEIQGWPGKGQPGNENTFGISEMKLLGARSVL